MTVESAPLSIPITDKGDRISKPWHLWFNNLKGNLNNINVLENFEYDKRISTEDSDENIIQYDYERPVGTNIATMVLTYNAYGHISTAVITGANNATLTWYYKSDNKTFDYTVLS